VGGQVLVDEAGVGQQRHLLSDFLSLGASVQTEHPQLADGGTGSGGDEPKEGGFPGAIGPGEQQGLAARQRVADPGEGPLCAKPFADVSQLDGGGGLHLLETYPRRGRARSKIGKSRADRQRKLGSSGRRGSYLRRRGAC